MGGDRGRDTVQRYSYLVFAGEEEEVSSRGRVQVGARQGRGTERDGALGIALAIPDTSGPTLA